MQRKRWIALSALIAYSAMLIRVIVFKAAPAIHLGHLRFKFSGPHAGPGNLVPFRTIWPSLTGRTNYLIGMVNLVGNIILFIPVGFLAAFIFRRVSWQTSLVLAMAVGLVIEGMEVVFRVGIFDIDDILLNAFGVMIGYGVFARCKRVNSASDLHS